MKWVVGIAVLFLATVCIGQTDDVHIVPRIKPPVPKSSDLHLPDAPLIKVNVDLALVPVVVTDDQGRPFPGLVKDHFQLRYDGQPTDIKYFSEDDAPVSIGLIFDRSGSMGWKIDQAKAVVKSFGAQLNPQDEIFMITFADTIDSTDFANVSDEIDSKMLFVGSKGRTSMLDAIYLGLSKMRTAKYQRRALIIVSDGGDNHSRYTEGEVKRQVEEADIQVFSIALVNPQCLTMDVPGGPHNDCSTEERTGPWMLQELAQKGGGTFYLLSDPRDIEAAVEKIGRVLRQEYLLGFTPRAKKEAKYHKLKVKLQRLPKLPQGVGFLHVDARQGFYATE